MLIYFYLHLHPFTGSFQLLLLSWKNKGSQNLADGSTTAFLISVQVAAQTEIEIAIEN